MDTGNVYNASLVVEKGKLEIFVGGGQPDFYPSHVAVTVTVQDSEDVYKCENPQ